MQDHDWVAARLEGGAGARDHEGGGVPGRSGGRASGEPAEQVPGRGAGGRVHDAAAHGIAGSGGSLPFADQIQRSFGRHDVRRIQAHVDGRAAEGARAIGAQAFAMGEHVAFAGAPDLHTAAHEAAHVVQQRGGVQLAGGIDRPGDAYERHADAVAARVVAGESAEDLLDAMAGAGAAGREAQVGAVQRQPVNLPAGALGAAGVYDTDHMTLDQMRTYADDPNTQAADKAILERKLYKSAGSLPAASVSARWVASYTALMAAYPNVAVANAAARATALAGSFDAAFGANNYRLENYLPEMVAAVPEIAATLTNIENALAGGGIAAGDANAARALVADLLLFNGLVVSKEPGRKIVGDLSLHSRYAIEVMPPDRVANMLGVVDARLGHHAVQDVHQDPQIQSIGLTGAETDPERMLKLSLLNARQAARAAIVNDPAYQAILALAGDDILDYLIASTGADEQYFMSTCPLASRNARIATQAMTAASLLVMGENRANRLLADVAVNAGPANARVATGPLSRRFGRTAGQLVTSRANDALNEFGGLRQELVTMAQNNATDYERLKEIRRIWSYHMQKLGGCVNWQSPDDLGQLAKKRVKDHWGGSAVPAFFVALGQLANPDATTNYVQGPDEVAYGQQTDQDVIRTSPPGINNTDIHTPVRAAGSLAAAMPTLDNIWTNLLQVGGTVISQSHLGGSHALFLKAILHNGVRTFALNDPKVRAYKYFSYAKFYDYLLDKPVTIND